MNKTRIALAAALLTLLSGCAHHHMHHHGQGGAVAQNPQIRIVEAGAGNAFASVDQEPIILLGSAVAASFEALEKSGQARKVEGVIEARMTWQLPASTSYEFNPAERGSTSSGIYIEDAQLAPGQKADVDTRRLIALTFKECTRVDARQFGCWVSLKNSLTFKYSINLNSPTGPAIHVDPTGVIHSPAN